LAEKLLGIHEEDKATKLAPTEGTAWHHYVEYLSGKYDDPENTLVETKVVVGEVEGYGPIKGTMDRFEIDLGHGIDWKLMGKKRIKQLARGLVTTRDGMVVFDPDSPAAGTLKKYYAQLQLYGKGMEDAGHEVNALSLLCITRDSTTETVEQGATEIQFPYDRKVAESVLLRASQIYAWASDPDNNVDELDSDDGCWYCKYTRGRMLF